MLVDEPTKTVSGKATRVANEVKTYMAALLALREPKKADEKPKAGGGKGRRKAKAETKGKAEGSEPKAKRSRK